ncbi:MAG: rhomboid family intramembrane serine protease [Candidatus Methanomethyliaceae archaeon]|nr:rhomboid family intramembrane serine protease [Candidatus Methanomethyliaceae archaeon]
MPFNTLLHFIGNIKMSLGVPIPGSLGRPKYYRLTLSLIILNIAVYAISSFENNFLGIGDYWLGVGGFVPLMITTPSQWYRVLSSMFLHSDPFHLLFNMYFLFIFGRAIENSLGKGRFILLYLSSGIFASLFHTAFGFIEGTLSYTVPAIGASGAISGILGAYLMLYPGTSLLMVLPIFLLPWIFWIKASYYIIFWFATQVIYGFTKTAGGTAVFAHAGGFVAGIALLSILANKNRIYQLRLLRSISFPNYLRFTRRAHRGLGRLTKVVLSLFMLSLLASSTYASFFSTDQGSMKLMTIHYTCNSVSYNDYLGFRIQDLESQISNTPLTTTRILLNRLNAAALLYNTTYAQTKKELTIINWTSYLPIRLILDSSSTTVAVPTTVYSFKGLYDQDGIVTYAEGLLTTNVVNIALQGSIYKVTIGETLTYIFVISSQSISLNLIQKYTGAISTILTIFALALIVLRDKTLAIVGED